MKTDATTEEGELACLTNIILNGTYSDSTLQFVLEDSEIPEPIMINALAKHASESVKER